MRVVPFLLLGSVLSCGGGSSNDTNGGPAGDAGDDVQPAVDAPLADAPPPPKPACEAEGGSTAVAAPELSLTLKDRWEEGWLASPAVVDLDGDGKMEIVAPRGAALEVWGADGALKWRYDTAGRIWASPVVGNFLGDGKLEIAVAARGKVHLVDAAGTVVPGFPVTWLDEIRALAAGDVDKDGALEIVGALADGSPTDVMMAWKGSGAPALGFPPNATATSGCGATKCYLAGCYDQNLAVGDLDGDGAADVVAPHDNAYASFHKGSGVAFDAHVMFENTRKTPGIRYLHALSEAKQGWAPNEATALQAHFTNTAPAIADLDGDGKPEVIMLASVQNAAQTAREKGVAVWVVRSDGSRLPAWETPLHVPGYVAGLWDLGGNIVGATNQLSVADIDASSPGPELVFAGFDGKIHAVSAAAKELWSFTYTTDPKVLTGGVVIGDLSKDGIPEIVFSTYSTEKDRSALFVLDASGRKLHEVKLSGRGAMPVPTLADVGGDGTVEIVVSLKDAVDKVESVRVYTVKGSGTKCLPWPTGRGNWLRNGFVPPK
ncbi:MAG: VCBS repeat-containing protein [Deltaproteobacteria bacterium]|nr:VCBS repeat-containing protein [Deltaproteobacteria bacterium]